MNLLYLAHRIPYPPNKGDKIRSWNQVRFLSERHRVHLGCLVDQPEDVQHVEMLRPRFASLEAVPIDARRARWASLGALASHEPLSVRYFASRRLHAWVERLVQQEPLDAVVVFSSQMAAYVQDVRLPRLMDFCDVDSAKWREYARRAPLALRPIYALEARRLAAFERRVLQAFDAATLVTAKERELWRHLPAPLLDKVHVVPNGVDLDTFSPQAAPPGSRREAHALVFTGAMDYWANVDAVVFFAREVLPRIRAAIPDATFYVVGSRPAPEVRALVSLPGVVVTGFVDDIRSYYARAGACVVPLRIARGIQNKVLEAMAMGRPVLATPAAFEGLGARAGRDLEVADGAAALAEAAVRLLRDVERSEAMGAAARRFVEREYVWERAMHAFERLVVHVAGHRGGAVSSAVATPAVAAESVAARR